MTRLAIVADVHIGNHSIQGGPVVCSVNERCRSILGVLSHAKNTAHILGCSHFIVAGDLFDSWRVPPQVIANTQRVFRDETMSVTVMAGNHDIASSAIGDGVISCLEDSARIVWNGVNNHDGLSMLPWCDSSSIGAVEALLEEGRPKALVCHAGVLDSGMKEEWKVGAHDAMPVGRLFEAMAKHGTKILFAGHWHEHRVWRQGDMTIVQVGALCPTGWDNPSTIGQPDPYGSLIIWDSNNPTVYQRHVIPGPRFISIKYGEPIPKADDGCHLFVRQTVRADMVSSVMASSTPGVTLEVQADRESAEMSARSAASAAASKGTLADALVAYVDAMGLEDDDKTEVLAKCRSRLGV